MTRRQEHPGRARYFARLTAMALDETVNAERFWEKVDKLGPVARPGLSRCWIWTRALEKRGYGWCRAFNRTTFAHRVSWRLTHGTWPDGWVLHSCDTPACVNPDHLRIGNHADNIRDMVERGRVPHPETRSPLSRDQVKQIRALHAVGETGRSLAARFGVGQATISRIVNHVRWKNVG